jgi:hypothetical protein
VPGVKKLQSKRSKIFFPLIYRADIGVFRGIFNFSFET